MEQKKYNINKKSKNQYRIMIKQDDPLIKKYQLLQNEKIYYNIYIDKLYNKHLIISRNKLYNNQIIYATSTKIYKNSVRSKSRTFLFNSFYIDLFNLNNFSSVMLKDLNDVNGFLFEMLFI